eukprot:1160316-Pelagomonas_calceolata.AAC.3
MAWGSHVLSSGSRDRTILQRDVRAPEHFSAKLQGHRSEICGLKVSKAMEVMGWQVRSGTRPAWGATCKD